MLVGLPKSLSQISMAPGVKWNFWQDMLLTASVLTSVSNSGLKASVTPVIGLDWSFRR